MSMIQLDTATNNDMQMKMLIVNPTGAAAESLSSHTHPVNRNHMTYRLAVRSEREREAVRDCRVFDWHHCGACTLQPSAHKELAFASSPDYTTGAGERVVNFCGCSELYVSGDRIFPLSFKEVYLQFYLEPITSSHNGTLRRCAIPEILLKAAVGVTHLQCLLCSVSDYALETLAEDFDTAATLKVLPLLAA
ncbi:unnamed protein product [Schistocephalus solidus]|uniref:Mis18 domain-containing protein n=1 Tax=Schistocephalus solidus TaxID=70667 RepID=A0A183S8E9_SCHSO|nr:unnamed protein product [Schistocephalus solidus]